MLIVSTEKHWQEALTLGADDFLEKPLNANKLFVHLNRLLRPIHQEAAIEDYPPFRLNTAQQQITLDDNLLELSPAEYALAAKLLRNFGKVLSFQELMNNLASHEESVSPKLIANRIVNIKRKLNLHAVEDWRLETVYQHGYRLVSKQYDTQTDPT